MLSGDNGLLKRAGDARDETIVGQEKEQVELAYVSAAVKKLGSDVTDEDLQTELNVSVGNNKTKVTQNSDNTLNVLFKDTKHNYNVNNGQVAKVDVDDTNDGVYIGEKKIFSKLYVPSKDNIISDTLIKFGIGGRSNGIANDLLDLAVISQNSDYLGVLKDLGYISQDYSNFVKLELLDNITSSNWGEGTFATTSGAPMLVIQKTSENKYNLVLGWYYEFEKQGTTLYKNKALITSEITFLNNDCTEYELGNIKLVDSAYECNTTNEAPFGDDLSKYTNANNEIENFSLVYNGKKYEGTSGLKQFLDNVIGLKNKEIASRYIDIATYVDNVLGGNGNGDLQRLITKYGVPSVKNASIVSNYVKNSNNLDGIYIKGERVTNRITTEDISEDEENLMDEYLSRLFQLWNAGILRDFKPFEYFLSKQLIEPTILNVMLKTANAYPNSTASVRNVASIHNLSIEESYESGYDYHISVPYTYDITLTNSDGELMDTNVTFDLTSQIKIEANDEVVFSDFKLLYNESVSLTFFQRDTEGKFKWDDFRKNGILDFMSENILPYPDKQEFWTIANEYASKDNNINTALSTYNNSKTKNNEIDLYVYVYRSILKEAIDNGDYVLKQDGKTYTGKGAMKNFLIEKFELDNADKVREMVPEEEEEEELD